MHMENMQKKKKTVRDFIMNVNKFKWARDLRIFQMCVA